MIMTRTRAIVLRTVKYGDSSLVVDMLTEAMGRMSFMVRLSASRKGKMRKQLFQPLHIVEIDFDYRSSASLQRISDIRIATPLVSLPLDPYKLSIALFVAEFVCYATRGEQANEPLYKYVENSISWLDGVKGSFSNFHLVFMIRVSRFIGFLPNTEDYREGDYFDMQNGCFCQSVPPHSHYLAPLDASKIGMLMRLGYNTMHLCAMTRDDRNRCTEVILDYYRLHVPGFPELKSYPVLKQLFC